MKRILLSLVVIFFVRTLAAAQTSYLPDFQIGIKAGANYSLYPAADDVHNKGQIGYILGAWARFGGSGLFFQPEIYGDIRRLTVTQNSNGYHFINYSKFTTADVPLLVGYKTGNANFGTRIYTGPEVAFTLAKLQSFTDASISTRMNFKDENYAWQIGAGVDIKNLSLDLRYEEGLNTVGYGPQDVKKTRMNFFNITLSYSLFSDFGL